MLKTGMTKNKPTTDRRQVAKLGNEKMNTLEQAYRTAANKAEAARIAARDAMFAYNAAAEAADKKYNLGALRAKGRELGLLVPSRSGKNEYWAETTANICNWPEARRARANGATEEGQVALLDEWRKAHADATAEVASLKAALDVARAADASADKAALEARSALKAQELANETPSDKAAREAAEAEADAELNADAEQKLEERGETKAWHHANKTRAAAGKRPLTASEYLNND